MLLVGTGAAALTAVIEVNEAPFYAENRSIHYGGTVLTDFYAPLPVFFEGWKSEPRAEIAAYTWDFGDGSPLMNGFNGAHIYEAPGVYTATLTVRDQNGAVATASMEITVRARDGRTFYVDAETGDDANAGLSPDAAWRTATHAFQGLAQRTARYQPGDQILFRRGQTFDFENNVAIGHNKNYGYVFGTYGEGPRPVIQYLGGAEGTSLFAHQGRGLAHVGFMDLEFRCTTPDGSHTAGFWYSTGDLSQIFFLRCHIEDFGGGYIFSNGFESHQLSGLYIFESSSHKSISTHLFANASRLALINNRFDYSGNHLAYIPYADKAVIQGNYIARQPSGRTAMRVAGRAGFDLPTNNVWIENNYFQGWVDPVVAAPPHGDGIRYNGIMVHLGPNTTTPQGMQDVVFQRNTVVDGEKLVGMGSYERLEVRDNLLWTHSPWNEGHFYFSSHQRFDQRPMQDIALRRNFFVKDSPPNNMNTARFVEVRSYTGPVYPGRINHEGLVFEDNRAVITGGRAYWLDADDPTLLQGFFADANWFYTPRPDIVGGIGDTNYPLDDWQARTGHDGNTRVFDATTLPITGTASAPATVNTASIPVSYSGAADRNGSGVRQVHLWVRKDHGAWIKTPYTGEGSEGVIEYTPTQGNGLYRFWVQTEDNDGHLSLPKTVEPEWEHMAGKRTLSPFGDTETVYTGGVQKGPDPIEPQPEPDPVDTTPPSPGALSAPAEATSSPIVVSYSGAADNEGGSGLHRVRLYARASGGTWAFTGLESDAAADDFAFAPPAEGTYHFALVAVDNAGNESAAPSGTGAATTVFAVPPPPPPDSIVVSLNAPDYANSSPIPIGYSVQGASGLQEARLFFRRHTDQLWSDSGRTGTTATGSFSFTGATTNAAYHFAVRVTDANGTTPAPAPGSAGLATLIYDTVPPTAGSVSGPLVKGEGVLEVAYSGVSDIGGSAVSGVTLWVRPPGGTWASTGLTATSVPSGVFAFEGLGQEGAYHFAVRVTDNAGNASPVPSGTGAWTYIHDLTPPTLPSLSVAPFVNQLPITISYSGASDSGSGLAEVVLWARREGQAWAPTGLVSSAGSGQFAYGGALLDGTYAFSVRAVDAAGNQTPVPSGNGLAQTVLDRSAPLSASLSAPVYATSSPIAVSYNIGKAPASGLAEVRLWVRKDGGSWQETALASTQQAGVFNYTGMSGDGAYHFYARVEDQLGNRSELPTGVGAATTTYDTTPPQQGTLTTLETLVTTTPLQLLYSGVIDEGSGLEDITLYARRGTGPWEATGQTATASSGVFEYTPPQDGRYAFALRPRDKAGNHAPLPTGDGQATITLDSTPPETGTIAAPDLARENPLAISYSGVTDGEDGSGLREVALFVRRGSGAWAATGQTRSLSSGEFQYTVTTGDGTYQFALRAEDEAGNRSLLPAEGQAQTVFDTTAPEPGTAVSPPFASASPVMVEYAGATDNGSGVAEVALWARRVGGNWAPVPGAVASGESGAFAFEPEGDGQYFFALRARDRAGNESPEPVVTQTATFFDTEAPDPGALVAPAHDDTAPITVTYSGASDGDGSGLATVRLFVRKGEGGAWIDSGLASTSASGIFRYRGMTGSDTYYFATVAEDRAGNASPLPAGDGMASTNYNTDFSAGELESPPYATESPILVTYSGARDLRSEAEVQVHLWVKRGEDGDWADTGLVESGEQGVFAFEALDGDGPYHFSVQAENAAGERTAAPEGQGKTTTILDTVPPFALAWSSPVQAGNVPVEVDHSGVYDAGSGVARVTLWTRQGTTGPWINTGLEGEGDRGVILWEGPAVDGEYYFYLQAEDRAGLVSPAPDEALDEGPQPVGTPVLLATAPVVLATRTTTAVPVVVPAPGGAYYLLVDAAGASLHGEPPRVRLRVNGALYQRKAITTAAPSQYMFPVHLEPGAHEIGLTFINPDADRTGQRFVRVDRIALQALGEAGIAVAPE